MLLAEIKIAIKNTAEHQKEFDKTYVFLRRKQLYHLILRVLNENSFRQGFYHTFLRLLLRIISYTLNVLNVLLGYKIPLTLFSEKRVHVKPVTC